MTRRDRHLIETLRAVVREGGGSSKFTMARDLAVSMSGLRRPRESDLGDVLELAWVLFWLAWITTGPT